MFFEFTFFILFLVTNKHSVVISKVHHEFIIFLEFIQNFEYDLKFYIFIYNPKKLQVWQSKVSFYSWFHPTNRLSKKSFLYLICFLWQEEVWDLMFPLWLLPLMWFICLLEHGSFHLVPCFPPFLGVLWLLYGWWQGLTKVWTATFQVLVKWERHLATAGWNPPS